MLLKRNKEISEVLFPHGSILKNTFTLNNSDKYQIFAILIKNDDNGKKSRYFLIEESNHFIRKIHRSKLEQLIHMKDQFDYILMVYTKPSLVKRIKFLNNFPTIFSNNLLLSNSQYLFECMIKNTNEFLLELGIKPYKHVIVSRSHLTSIAFKKNYIKKEFQDMAWNQEWISNFYKSNVC